MQNMSCLNQNPAWLGVTAMQGPFVEAEVFTLLQPFC